MKKLLIHTCCAPCLISPYSRLKSTFDITALWYNHNIHPFVEYGKRLDAFREFIKAESIDCIEVNEYGLVGFLQKSVFREDNRCFHCYYDRLEYVAIIAKKEKYDYFTTSLLYSKFQKHELIKEIGFSVAKKYQVEFYYEDFRDLWKEGVQLSKEKGMYRQQYCGCIYSEYERYCPPLHPSQEGK